MNFKRASGKKGLARVFGIGARVGLRSLEKRLG